MDTAAASSSVALASSRTTEQLAQNIAIAPIATAPTALAKVNKEITREARAADSKKRATRQAVAMQREKDKKLTEERAK
jgi:hypothetical protein